MRTQQCFEPLGDGIYTSLHASCSLWVHAWIRPKWTQVSGMSAARQPAHLNTKPSPARVTAVPDPRLLPQRCLKPLFPYLAPRHPTPPQACQRGKSSSAGEGLWRQRAEHRSQWLSWFNPPARRDLGSWGSSHSMAKLRLMKIPLPGVCQTDNATALYALSQSLII